MSDDWKVPAKPQTQQEKAEAYIRTADPSGFAEAIIAGEFKEIAEGELREMLASAFSAAARTSSEGSGNILTDELHVYNQRLITMAMDLRINLSKLTLRDQIFLFYPHLKKQEGT